MPNKHTAEKSARREPRNQSLFTPFKYTFPRARFTGELVANSAEIADFYGMNTFNEKLQVLQAALVSAQSLKTHLEGFVNDFTLQIYALHTAMEEYQNGVCFLGEQLDDINKMALLLVQYETDKIKDNDE